MATASAGSTDATPASARAARNASSVGSAAAGAESARADTNTGKADKITDRRGTGESYVVCSDPAPRGVDAGGHVDDLGLLGRRAVDLAGHVGRDEALD